MHLLTKESPLIVMPTIACMIGVEKTLFLQQLHYRLQQQTALQNGEVWYCQTFAKWSKQMPFWNEAKIKRIIRHLEELGIVHSTDKLNQFYVDRTKWYKIDYEKLQSMLEDYKQNNDLDEFQLADLTMTSAVLNAKPTHNKKKPQNKQHAAQIDEVLTYLNDKASKKFNLKSQSNRNYIGARLKEGYSVADCCLVIDEQSSCWLGDLEMEKYLRPMTLFRPANFDSYLNNALSKQQATSYVPKPVVLDFNAGEDW